MDTVSTRPVLQWGGHRRGRRRFLWMSVTASIAALIIAIGVLIAQANHNFSDVPTGTYYHDAVEWIFNRGITAGIGGGQYGTGQSVRREDMAVFMRKLGIALTPTGVLVEDSPGALDLDVDPRICAMTTDYNPTFPQSAGINSWVSLKAAGAMGFSMHIDVSTDSGATWTQVDNFFSRGGSSAVDEWAHVNQHSGWNLDRGTNYRFAIHVLRDSGTADATSSRCELQVFFFNRNPTAPPLGPGQHELPGGDRHR